MAKSITPGVEKVEALFFLRKHSDVYTYLCRLERGETFTHSVLLNGTFKKGYAVVSYGTYDASGTMWMIDDVGLIKCTTFPLFVKM